MKGKSEISVSLYMEWFILMFLAGMVSLLFFMGGRFLIEYQIDKYHRSGNIVQAYNDKYISELREYIQKYGISSNNLYKLDEWMNDNRLIYIQIKKNDEYIYSSAHYMNETKSDEYDLPVYPEDSYYNIDLEDGEVQVFIMGMYSYNIYMVAMVINIVLSFILFIMITMLGLRRKIRYINQLSSDIEILEAGDLNYEVHIQGNDEITEIARGLNSMKTSFNNKIEEVECLTKTNQKMMTEISHDLRTPLTAVLLYTEILKNEKYGNEENKQEILDKIIKKIQHMKGLSDGLLSYGFSDVEEKYVRAEYMSVHSALYDELSDMCQYLQEQGIKIKVNLQWQKGQIFVYQEYLIRIMDNIASNILKYADKQATVLIWDEYYMDEMCIVCENTSVKGRKYKESSHIGIRNIRTLMKEMEGKCDVSQSDEMFMICLRFKYRTDDGLL